MPLLLIWFNLVILFIFFKSAFFFPNNQGSFFLYLQDLLQLVLYWKISSKNMFLLENKVHFSSILAFYWKNSNGSFFFIQFIVEKYVLKMLYSGK